MSSEKKQNVTDVIDAIKDAMGFKKDSELADFIGVSRQNIYDWKIRDSIGDYKKFTDQGFCEYFVRTGKGPVFVNKSECETALIDEKHRTKVRTAVEQPYDMVETSEPAGTISEEKIRRRRYDDLAAKCQFLFDFLLDEFEGNSWLVDGFIDQLKNKYLKEDPDYRRWCYNKQAETEEWRKKKSEENHPASSLESKSVNGE